jgi:RNA polymerase sigma-70 factor (ECF subfamily)
MSGERVTHGAGEGADTFERWYREHHARLLAQCTRMLHDRAASEDIAQETLLRAWLGRDRMREEDVGAWLTVVARNLCISHIRKQKRAVPTEVLPETPDEAADPAYVVTRLESRRAVRRALRQVGGRQGAALFRREIEGVDYEELGTELGLSIAGTRTVMFRARRMLRERLAAAGEGVGAFVGGIKLRIRSLYLRGSRVMNSANAAMVPEGSAAFGFVVALGITLTMFGGGAFHARSVEGAIPERVARLDSTVDTVSRGGAPPTTATVSNKPNLLPPLISKHPKPKSPVTGYPIDRCDGTDQLDGDVAGEEFGMKGWREEGDLFEPLYGPEDVAYTAVAVVAPDTCRPVELR